MPDPIPGKTPEDISSSELNPEEEPSPILESTVKDAIDYVARIFEDELTQMEYLKIRQIGKEVFADNRQMFDGNGRLARNEIVARFFMQSYGVYPGEAEKMAGDWEKAKIYLRSLREKAEQGFE